MSKKKHSSGWSTLDELQFREQKTVYRGKIVTVGQAIALRAADAKRRKEKNEPDFKEIIYSDIYQLVRETIKSTKTLKSFKAFRTNGSKIWRKDYEYLMSICPTLSKALYVYSTQYDKVVAIHDELTEMLRRNKKHRSFISRTEDFTIQMHLLLDFLDKLIDIIQKKNITSIPGLAHKEIISGSLDGKRLGIRQIMSRTNSTVMLVRKNLSRIHEQTMESYHFTATF